MLRPFLACYRCFKPKPTQDPDITDFTYNEPGRHWNPFEIQSLIQEKVDVDGSTDDSISDYDTDDTE